jgi:ligand-binding sensor domain-containing protein/DNA-binding CsgD family transcriptional regulator
MKQIKIFRTLWVAGILILNAHAGFAQGVNLGNPPVVNFSKQKFKAGTQIWDIAQSKNGTMWFANNDGLLEFEGTHWRLHRLGNGTIVRAVQVGSDENIYVGGQGDFGFFYPNRQGRLQYQSLRNLLPAASQHFGDVWDVVARKEGVFFRTNNQVFWYHDQQVTAFFPLERSLFFMGNWGKELLVQDDRNLLYVFRSDRFEPLGSPAAFKFGTISSVLAYRPDTILVTTIKNGIFYCTGSTFEPWPTQNDHFLITNRIYCAGMLPNGKIALGTSLNGLVTLDQHRRIFQHINKKGGLQNNTVLSLFAPENGSLWLGLDNGIDFVDLKSPFSTFYPDGELQGTGYAAQVFGNKIYFGANTGLYATDWKTYYTPEERQRFSLVKGSEGQVWSLNLLDGRFLMGHHEGAFEVNGLDARKLSDIQGIWRFVTWSPNVAVAGFYKGLVMFKKTDSGWVADKVLNGLVESSRILAKDKSGAIWMAHPYRGIYRLHVFPEKDSVAVEFFNAKQGLRSDLGNHLFKLGDEVVFASESGAYHFDDAQYRFVPNQNFDQYLGAQAHIKYLRQDDAGNIWYVTDQETGVLLVENSSLDKKIRRMPIPELNDKLVGGFQFLLPVDEHNVFIATGQGFIHFDLAAYLAKDTTMRLVLQEVRLGREQDSVLFGGHRPGQADWAPCKLSYQQNSLDFFFSAPDFPAGEFVRYAHYLEGLESEWSDWDTETDASFNHLPPGEYVFHVKAKNQHGVESAVLTYPFTIEPPWYASRIAYVFYGLLCLGGVASIIYRQRVLFEQEKQDLKDLHQHREEEHQLNARRSEEEINRLLNEKLEAEVQFKTQELASATMHLVQKNEILNTTREGLGKLQNKLSDHPDLEKEVGRFIKMMERDLSIDADWEHFSQNFDQVHTDFIKRLSETHKHLSPNDYKLCAYLRMNLSSKEIATLLNISVRGVEASRYRLRKRLGLDTDTNLTEYLIRF